MSKFRQGIIQALEPDECEICHKFAELKPYGPNRENICYECGMKDVKTTEKMMHIKLFGDKYIQ